MRLTDIIQQAGEELWATGSDRSHKICLILGRKLGITRKLSDVDPDELVKHCRKLAASSRLRYRAAWMGMLRWASKRRLVEVDLERWSEEWPPVHMRVVDGVREGSRERFLSAEEAQRLLEAAAGTYSSLFEFLLQTGARASEALTLRWRDVDQKARTVTFTRTKNGKPRTVPLSLRALGALQASPAGFSRDGPWWSFGVPRNALGWSPTRAYDRANRSIMLACDRAGLKDVTLHTLRHTFASWFIQRGGHITQLRVLLGHRNISQTMRYAHLAPDFLDAAREVIDS